MRVVWLIQNVVPYHHARFEAFAALDGIEGHIVQAVDHDAFRVLECSEESSVYQLHTLLKGGDPADVPSVRLKHAAFGLLKKLQPDCVFVSGWGLAIGQSGLRAAFTLGIPVVLCSDSNVFDEQRAWYKEAIKQRIVSPCSAYFVAGTSAAEYVEGLGGADCVKGYDVVDNQHFARRMEQPARFPDDLADSGWFFACSRFGSKKNLTRLIEAHAEYVKHCKAAGQSANRLIIAGDGALRDEIEASIVKNGLSDKVLLLGAVPYEELPWLYQNCQAFILPSTTEQWGLVVNEAMAAGAPVLVSRRCGCAVDLVQEEENGFLFKPHDVGEISSALCRFHGLSVEEKKSFGQESLRIISGWSVETFARGMHAAADKAVAFGAAKGTMQARLLLNMFLKKGGSIGGYS